MGSSVLGIGISGLAAAQAGLVTTGHNIANASTDGYNRQSIVQGTNVPIYSGVGYFGQGTNIETVKRSYNDFLGRQVLSADTNYQELSAYYTQIKQIDDLFGDTTAGLSSAVQGFFAGVQSVAKSPTDASARQSMLATANALASRFQILSGRLEEMRTLQEGTITGVVSEINGLASQIGSLNQQIVLAANQGSGQPPNDLYDKRDQLITQLNQQVRVSVQSNDDKSINVFIGNGQPLVVGVNVSQLTTAPSTDDISRIAVGIKLPSGGSAQLPDSAFSGGQLSGLLSARSQAIDETQNALGRLALGITETFNAQHLLGQDQNGNPGVNFFNTLAGTSIYPNNPSNTGTASFTVPITNVSSLTTSDYKLTYTAANTFQLVRQSDGQVWTASGASVGAAMTALTAITANEGFSLNLTGAPNVGDHFLIEPTRTAANGFSVAIQDTHLIAAASQVRTSATNANTGTAKIDAGVVTNATSFAALNLALTPVTLTYNGTNLTGFPAVPISVTAPNGTVTNYPAGGSVAYVDGGKIAFSGMSFTISGQPGTNDTFTLDANTGGVNDSRNAIALGQLQTAKTLLGGTASYESTYAQMISKIGSQTAQYQVTAESQKTVLQQNQSAYDSFSGVNLDEEAANLIRYQQAYEASGRVMSVASKLFDTILAIASSA